MRPSHGRRAKAQWWRATPCGAAEGHGRVVPQIMLDVWQLRQAFPHIAARYTGHNQDHTTVPAGILRALGFIAGGMGLIVIATAAAALTQWPMIRRLRLLAGTRDRRGAREAFHAALPELPEHIRIEAYRLLQGVVPVDDCPILPEDDLWGLLAIDQGDLETALEDYCEQRSWPAPRGALTGSTAADFARMLYRCMQRERDIS